MQPKHNNCYQNWIHTNERCEVSDNSWPGVRLKDSPASDSFTRSDISRSAHIESHCTGSIKQQRQKHTASNIWACSLCAVSPVVLCSVSGCCYRNTHETSWQYNVYKELTQSSKLPRVQHFWHIWSVTGSRFEIYELHLITSRKTLTNDSTLSVSCHTTHTIHYLCILTAGLLLSY